MLNHKNISKQEIAAERVIQTAQEWQIAMDSVPAWIYIVDVQYKIIRANKSLADFLKTEPEKLAGRTCYELMHGTGQPPAYCTHQQTLLSKKTHISEFFEPYLNKQIELTTSPILDNKNEMTGSVHIIKDVTEQKKRQEQLIITDRLATVGEMVSGITHELNNPLTSIIGFSRMLMEKDLPDDLKEYLTLINSEARRSAEIIKNLLTFARKHEPAKCPGDINNAIDDTLKLRAYELESSNIKIVKNLSPGLPLIIFDYFQMLQVFLNIIVNAEYFIKETSRPGILTIATSQNSTGVIVTFTDNGPGIPGDALPRIFDPFFTTKPVGKGTGLGLSICHSIVTEHNGKLYAASRPGEGATFTIELPASGNVPSITS